VKRCFLLILLIFLCYSDMSYGAAIPTVSSPPAVMMTPASSGTPSAVTPASSGTPSAAEKKPDKPDKSTPVPEVTSSSEALNLNYDSDEPNKIDQEKTKESSDTSQPAGFLTKILNMITSLGIVCLLVYVVLKLLYAKGAGIIPQPKKNLFVMEQIQLQPQKTMFLPLVKAGSRVLLVGATEKEITLLKEFEPEAFAVPADTGNTSEENKSAFKEEFSNIMNNNRGQAGILSRIFQTFGLYGLASVFTRHTKNR